MALTTDKVTAESVKAEIERVQVAARERLRHLRALLRCLEDEKKEGKG